MATTQFERLINSMTVSVFASLPTAWPEYVIYGGKLIARIHPNCNRRFDDGSIEHDVVARAVVYVPNDELDQPHGLVGLRRLTIRERNLEFDPKDISDYLSGLEDAHMLPNWQQIRNNYWRCLEDILAMPAVDLHDPLRGMSALR